MGRNLSYNVGRKQAKILLYALLSFVEDLEESKDCKADWQADTELWVTHSTLEGLAELTNRYNDSLDAEAIRNALNCLISLKIIEDKRGQTNAKTKTNSKVWLFALKFPSINKDKNINWLFDQGGEWDKCREAQKNNSAKVPKPPKEKSQGDDWQKISRAMLEKHKRLTTNELLFADDEMKFELNDIHVPLALVERTKTDKRNQDISPEQGSQLYKPSSEEKQFEHQAFLEQVIHDGVDKTQERRIALIGEPGAGKTTQLQTIAFWILEENLGFPIWISLADLQTKNVEDYLLQDWLKNALKVRRVTEEQENAFVDLFKNNSVWLLLDAADEMSSLQPLTEISQQLTGWVEDARVVLTCRMNVWEANANALENFETYRLLNFAYPQQVQEFIGRWFYNKDADKGERLWQELDKPERQRIQDLVKNPLRLALLCSTWQSSDKGLPETKAGLYQQFVEEFYKWKENRFSTTEQQQEELNAALGRLAKRAIDEETSRFRLRHKLVREELGDPKQQNSLFWLALKLGWLNEVGLAAESATKEKVYAFYHPTFEEYFAALAINDRHEFLNHVPNDPALGVYRIFAPQWKEVILLWLGREDVEREKKEKFIQALVEFDDGCGEYRAIDRVRRGFYEFRAYFLAAAGVDEWKNSGNADAIVVEIVKWGFGEFKVEQNEWVKFLQLIEEGARTALPQTNRIKAIDALVELISKPQLNYYTRMEAVSSLGQIGSGNQKAIAALVELISKPQLDDFILRQAAESLEKIDPGNQKVIDALVELISKPQLEYSRRREAAYSLRKIGSGNQRAIDALVELIGKPQLDDHTRRQAAFSLGQIDPGNQRAIDALVELIDNPQLNDFILSLAVESLEQIGSGNQKAIDTLVKLIGNPQHNNIYNDTQRQNDTQKQAAKSLRKIGSGNQEAIDALVELIGNPQLDDYTRRLAAHSLEKISSGNQEAIDVLVELINKPQLDDKTRWLAAYSLGEISSGKQKAIDALVELIGKPQLDDDTRWLAAESLGKIDPGNQTAIDALVELIGKPQLDDSSLRRAAESLGQIGSGNQKAIDALVELISKPQLDNDTRWRAAESLGQIGSGNQKAIDALVELIGKSQLDDSSLRLAAESLGKIGSGNQKAIDALVELIGNPQLDNYNTLRLAVSSLEKIDPGNQKVIDALVELIGNPQLCDSSLMLAVSSLGKIGSGNQKAIDALVELIGNPQLDNYNTLRLAVSSLEKIDPGNQKVIDALVELISNPQLDDSTRMQAAFSLGQIGSGNQKAIAALVELISNPQLDDSTRMQVAESLGQIGSGNQKAIAALVELIAKPQLDDHIRRLAVSSLGQIDPGNQKAIAALVELISNPQLDDSTRMQVAESLGQIDPGNQKAITALVELIGNSQLNDSTRRLAASSLEEIMLDKQMPSVVSVLKDYLSPETYKNDFERFDNCYKVIWKCAQSMTYPDFYQAWHQQEKVKNGE